MPKLSHDRPHRIWLAGRSVDVSKDGVAISDDEAAILSKLEGDHGYRIVADEPIDLDEPKKKPAKKEVDS